MYRSLFGVQKLSWCTEACLVSRIMFWCPETCLMYKSMCFIVQCSLFIMLCLGSIRMTVVSELCYGRAVAQW